MCLAGVEATGTGQRRPWHVPIVPRLDTLHPPYLFTTDGRSFWPSIDGDPSDAAWQRANVLGQLVQQVPVPGGPPSQTAEVRLVYDDTALYLAFYAYESDPAAVTRTSSGMD